MKAELPFTGAPRPARFVVVRWPDREYLYFGSLGAEARQAYEFVAPKEGETVEFWEMGDLRGSKTAEEG